ncbi:putative quinol monooxygenase [Cohaesibacter celericrescens]|uniref:Antibiotic biosynthesis monooxygenase n=1 Tax=Cohaesibacter celericrescens TaxID=2067669 RepID=A0A2N5XVQ9_9HYPH|nr:antibiotic biosynthesis monooxygenase [Cohaesibacter celericrescens]PLW78584.1 antibiotic biosynthesis monooxygenase [Cohaesibacter celericrescens]
MFVVCVTFSIIPEHIRGFRTLVLEQARNTLSTEVDCHQFDVCVNVNEPEKVFLYELYTNPAAFDYHLKTGHFMAFNKTTEMMVLSKTVNTYQQVQ